MYLSGTWQFWPFQRSWTSISWGAYGLSYSQGGGVAQVGNKALRREGSEVCRHYDDDEMFLWYGWPTEGIWPYFQPESLSQILTFMNLQHPASKIWICTKPEFRQYWQPLHHSTTNTALQIWHYKHLYSAPLSWLNDLEFKR